MGVDRAKKSGSLAPASAGAGSGELFEAAASRGLFVGIGTFDDPGIPAIPYAVDDAIDLAALFCFELKLLEPSGVLLALSGEAVKTSSRDHLLRLRAQGATEAAAYAMPLLVSLRAQVAAVEAQGLLVVSVASHGGSLDGSDFLLTRDSRLGFLPGGTLAFPQVFAEVTKARARRRLMLFDACRTPFELGARGGQAADLSYERLRAALGSAEGEAALMGTTFGGATYDDSTRQNGVFSAALIEGLRGKAGHDEAGHVTVGTLVDYVDDAVARWVKQNRPRVAECSPGTSALLGPVGATRAMPLARHPAAVEDQWRKSCDDARKKLRGLLDRNLVSGATYEAMAGSLGRVADEGSPEARRFVEAVLRFDGRKRNFDFLPAWEDLQRRYHDESTAAEPLPRIRPLLGSSSGQGRRAGLPRYWPLLAGFAGLVAVLAAMLWISSSETDSDDQKESYISLPTPASTSASAAAGELAIDGMGLRFRFIPAGQIVRKRNGELYGPFVITQPFWTMETEVPQRLWQELFSFNPSKFDQCGAECPVERVSWCEALAFANRLSEKVGLDRCYELNVKNKVGDRNFSCTVVSSRPSCSGYRLPSEAEWELAAWLPDVPATEEALAEIAWFDRTSLSATHPVGQLKANRFGLFDMVGNVREWTFDSASPLPFSPPPDFLAAGGNRRIARGGSWGAHARDRFWEIRAHYTVNWRQSYLGFRLVTNQRPLTPSQG